MKKQTKDLIFLGAALVGAYAAWLQIRQRQAGKQAFSDWFTSGSSFNTPGSWDFYGYDSNALDVATRSQDFVNSNTMGAL